MARLVGSLSAALACAAVCAGLAGAAQARDAATLPAPGVLVPGASLGGVRVGMTRAEVRRVWGSEFGRCRSCRRLTWYYNYRPFEPEGAGVAFERGWVVQVFTLWQPEGWRTRGRLGLGASAAEITQVYRALPQRQCAGYSALVLPGRAATVFYVLDEELWGFGLTRPGDSPCVESPEPPRGPA